MTTPASPRDADTIGRAIEESFGLALAVASPRRLYVQVPTPRLLEVVAWLHLELPGLRLATMTGIDLPEGLGVFYHFAVVGWPVVVTLKVQAPRSAPLVPSLAARLPSTAWAEREIHDLLGVTFEGHPDLRPLVKPAELAGTLPLRRDFAAGVEVDHG